MSFEFEVNADIKDVDLDKLLSNDENRKPNKLGLYRVAANCIASSGYGKSTCILKALLSNTIEDYGLIIIIIPRESFSTGYYKTIHQKEVPGFMFYIIGEDPLPSIEQINSFSNEVKKPIALVLDDYVNCLQKQDWLLVRRYLTQLSRVRYGCSLFSLTQDLYTLPPSYRKGFNVFIIFPASLTQMQFNDILRNYYQNQSFTTEELKSLYSVLKKDKHGSLWLINNNDAEHSMMYNNVWIKKAY